MSKQVKIRGRLRRYYLWPFLFTLLLILMNLWIYTINMKCGLIVSACILIYLAGLLVVYASQKIVVLKELIGFSDQYGLIQTHLLQELAVPHALLDEKGNVVWMNNLFSSFLGIDKSFNRSVTNLFPEFEKVDLVDMSEEFTLEVISKERIFRVELKKMSLEHLTKSSTLLDLPEEEKNLIMLYLFDETDINRYIRENIEQKLVVGYIYIDNYEEALEKVEEVRQSLYLGFVDRKINQYINHLDGLVKKIEKDKYFIVLKQKYVDTLKENNFSLLQEIKTINVGKNGPEMNLTLSIGLGMNGKSYAKCHEYARTAIQLALGRGGAQAVIKNREKYEYFGGKTKQVEKQTRVKARVKAHALREIIQECAQVVVMGHDIPDADSFGSCIGIYRAAKVLDKKAYIVINEVPSSVKPMIETFYADSDYEERVFIKSTEAQEIVDRQTVVVVVDVNKPSRVDCPEILYSGKSLVVFDHHRQSSKGIEPTALSYVEPYASSTCEMVAEILQYYDDDGVKIKNIEADSLYAGMMIDTNNFLNKTGVRTFEAAAFLKRCGADITRVRKMFQNDFASYQLRAEAISNAEIYRGAFTFASIDGEGMESPTVVGAQVSNELLNIIGIKASFVMTSYNHKIYISARSIDSINVQVIMEKLFSGGGHMNIAGAQVEAGDMKEIKNKIKEALDELMEEEVKAK